LVRAPVALVCSDQYGRRVAEQENVGKALRDRQKALRDTHDTSVAQMRLWRDVERLLACKRRLASGTDVAGETAAGPAAAAAAPDDDRLVL